ncbi:MAG: InlB B-repeat-containing protein [Eubacterium sp.]|nr:InlB B-repeat-containing protein [Eubacterium sp.]
MKLKETRKRRRKGFIALCLAVAMAFSYNVPAFAEEYVVNPNYESDTTNLEHTEYDVVHVDENLIDTVVWSGDDTFKANGSDSVIRMEYYRYYADEYDNDSIGFSDVGNSAKVAICNGDILINPGTDEYKSKYQSSIKAWKIANIKGIGESSGIRLIHVCLTPVTTYFVMFVTPGFKIDGSEADYAYFNYRIEGENVPLSKNDDTISKAGYEIVGFYEDEGLTKEIKEEEISNIKANMTIFVKVAPKEYTITYKTDGGEFAADYKAPESFTVESDEITLPTAKNISKDGYEFVGWYETEDFSGEKVTTIPSGTKSDKTFYAKYEAIRYNINYVTNGGAFADAANATYTTENKVVLQEITKEGQKFIGWFDNADFKGDAVTEIAKGSTGDKTFYAKFEEQEYDVEAAKTYQQKKDGEYLVHVIGDDITPDDVLSINVAGEEVDKSDASKVKLEIGSVKFTFTPDFMNGLKVGETKIEIQFKEGKAGTTVNILAPEEEKKDSNSGSVDSGTTDNKTTDDKKDTAVTDDKAKDASVEGGQTSTTGTDNAATTTKTDNSDSAPKTGDSFMLGFVIMLLTLSMAGIAVTQIARKKKESESDE